MAIAHLHDKHRQLAEVIELFELGVDPYVVEFAKKDDAIRARLLNVVGEHLLDARIKTLEFMTSSEAEEVEIRYVSRRDVLALYIRAALVRQDVDGPVDIGRRTAELRILGADGEVEIVALKPNFNVHSVGNDEIDKKVLSPFISRLEKWFLAGT